VPDFDPERVSGELIFLEKKLDFPEIFAGHSFVAITQKSVERASLLYQ
jgi:hypothetical protein